MLCEFVVNFDKELNKAFIFPVEENDIKNELIRLITLGSDSFSKSFEIEIRIDELNNMMYSRFFNLDHTWEKKYKKLTAGSIFMLIHSMMDYIDGINWSETVICHDKNDPKYDMFKNKPVDVKWED